MRAHPDDFLPFLPSEVDPDNMMSSGKAPLLETGKRPSR